MRTRLETLLISAPPETWRVRQVIAFEWYDGPREGLCELDHPACTFSFEIVAERWHADRFKDGIFRLYEIETGAVERAIDILHRAGPPTNPVWAPHGPYESQEEQRRVEEGIEEIVSKKNRTRVLVRTDDMIEFSEIWLEVHPASIS